MNLLYALSGTIFHVVLAILLMQYGNHDIQSLIMFGLLFGAVSQFLAQDHRRWVINIALAFSYLGMVLAVIAVVLFALS